MRKQCLSVLLPLTFVVTVQAQPAVPSSDRHAVTFIKDSKRLPDDAWQSELRARPAWQHFLQAHGQWIVEFNESNGKPDRAFGTPISTTGATPAERAMNFLANELAEFNIPMDELTVRNVGVGGEVQLRAHRAASRRLARVVQQGLRETGHARQGGHLRT